VVFDKNGGFQFEFGGFGIARPINGAKATWKPGLLDYPTDLAVDTNGDVYVADFYNDSISVFSEEGKFLRRFPDPNKQVGKGGSGAGGTGIAVTAIAIQDGKVYATDQYQVLVFDTRGKLLKQFGRPGKAPGDLDHPGGIAVDDRGRIYVSDSNNNRVTAFTPEGKPIWTAGTKVSDLMAETDNPFVLPRGLTVLIDGSILVADPLGQQLVKLAEDGTVVAKYGVRGDEPGQLNFPNDVSARKELILVSDRENDRVQVVKLVGP
jgi:DNA-binding beta-propeller fold protein YncE